MKLSRHNGRSGKKGVYKVNHNDRKFDIENAEHIDTKKAKVNIYWDCYQGYYSQALLPRNDGEVPASFLEIEKLYYHEHYSDYCDGQADRNHKARHFDRDRTTEDLRKDKRTCPEESILQIGNMDESVPPEILAEIAAEYFEEFNKRFGENIHILNWSLHLDEATPHIHERHVFDSVNKYGEVQPQQEKTLELLNIPLPDPEKKVSRTNNRKITFDKICRALLLDISKRHGLSLDEEPEFGGRECLEKQDYILQKQKEKIAIQEKKLERIEAVISDTEAFAEKVSNIAYEKAVEIVTEKVVEETHNADFEIIDDFKKNILHPDNPNKPEVKKLAAQLMDNLMKKFQGFTKRITEKLSQALRSPAVKESAKEPIKQSIMEELKRARLDEMDSRKHPQKDRLKNKGKGAELL